MRVFVAADAAAFGEDAPPEVRRIIHDCCAIIGREVASVKGLVDEFGRFARFPSVQTAPTDVNAAVDEGLAVFEGRLSGISLHRSFAPDLPYVALDREQFKRVIVNLVDNAAAKRKSIFMQNKRGGRASTMLTNRDTLGGG